MFNFGFMRQNDKREFTTPPKLYRIGDIVRNTPFKRQTIHNYTIMGLIEESGWTEGGHRLYDESVFEKLRRIQRLQGDQKTLAQIRDMFRTERMLHTS